MPKSTVPSPTAAVAIDRLALQSTDARATDHGASPNMNAVAALTGCVCFSEE